MNSEIDKDLIIKKQQEEILRLQHKVKKKEKKKINPYKILEIPKKYDQNMLKKSYMKKALIMHPDRGGDVEEFKLLGLSYKILLKKLEEKSQSHDYNELKSNHKEFVQENENNVSKKLEIDNFNINTFNEIYDEYKLKDNFKDSGYGNWLKSKENNENNENTKLKNNFTTNKFNSEFNKSKKKNNSKELITNEPMELISMRNHDSLELLGRNRVKNFSGSVGGLGYRDLKDAYENSTLIDITKVNIKDRDTNILYYEKNRENISYEMNESDLLHYNKKILKTNKIEEERINRLKKEDNMINRQYELIHQRLLN